jgi:hypothetical protein
MSVRACETARFVRAYANLAIDRSTSIDRCAFSGTFAIAACTRTFDYTRAPDRQSAGVQPQ